MTTSIGELEEDEEFTIDPLVTDTENDIEDLVFCYDLNPLTDSDLDGDERNDCDQNTRVLTHSWPDSHSSPDSILFFTFDDDGETDSLEFTFDVVNTPLRRWHLSPLQIYLQAFLTILSGKWDNRLRA